MLAGSSSCTAMHARENGWHPAGASLQQHTRRLLCEHHSRWAVNESDKLPLRCSERLPPPRTRVGRLQQCEPDAKQLLQPPRRLQVEGRSGESADRWCGDKARQRGAITYRCCPSSCCCRTAAGSRPSRPLPQPPSRAPMPGPPAAPRPWAARRAPCRRARQSTLRCPPRGR